MDQRNVALMWGWLTIEGEPFSGSAVQLPGRVFTSFLDSVEAEQPGTAQQAPYCQAAFDAITMDLNHTVYIFKGGQYWTVSTAGQVSSALLREGWPGLPRAIEAAAVSQTDGKFYFFRGEKWYKRHLTYRIVNGPRSLSLLQVRRAVRAAFELWSNVSALAFWEVMEGPADIRLAFYEGEHSDGVTNAFDGPGAETCLLVSFPFHLARTDAVPEH
ncbi:Matrix metalloproteinase-28 [Acipenser ruthenus]|uniref:Matrix metalloproteinase-28 n=1 Tax=Acipenser ruthenus TaxID=7906 RepID=A0A444V4S7_ACIRT|nr:Matrix metalloproteinase-28 [Acipenser ruthenus]